jgi:outer membrane biosynthesis protein TonB
MDFYEEDEPGFFQRHRTIVAGVFVVAVAIAVWLGQGLLHQVSQTHSEQRVVMVNLPPPPAPPPPPSPRPAQPTPAPDEADQKIIEQAPVTEAESKPDQTPKSEAPAGDSPLLGTSIQGDGASDGFGLRAGNGLGTGTGGTGETIGNGGGGGRWGWYAGQVQSTVSQALQSNNVTRDADFRVAVRIWADQNGRITRAHIAGSTGNAALDSAITNGVLVGLILQEPPPEGMPMPIMLRLTARHPTMAGPGSYQ